MSDEHDQRRAKVTDEHRREAAALLEIWNATAEKRKLNGVGSQLAFGGKYEIGNQSAVGFFLNGRTPLSLKAARGFAKGLECQIADFSPRLAAMVEPVNAKPRSGTATETSKPASGQASHVSERALSLARRLDALLDPESAQIAYARISNILDAYEAEQREAAYQASARETPTPAKRTRTRQPTPAR